MGATLREMVFREEVVVVSGQSEMEVHELVKRFVDSLLTRLGAPLVLQGVGAVTLDRQLSSLDALMVDGEEAYLFLRGEQSRIREALEEAKEKRRILKLRLAGKTGKI